MTEEGNLFTRSPGGQPEPASWWEWAHVIDSVVLATLNNVTLPIHVGVAINSSLFDALRAGGYR